MTHHAFVLGCNGLPGSALLKWARSDGDRMVRILRSLRCNYRVTRARRSDNKWAQVKQLEAAARACSPGDTFVFYFAGHGVLDQGKLHLVWQDKGKDEVDASVPVSVILDIVQRCQADNRLVILDCCHAGAAASFREGAATPVEEVTDPQPDNYLILMGSKRIGTVREFDDFGGTFLSATLRSALSERFHEADKDGDQRLSFTDLVNWINSSWKALDASRRKDVPNPHHFGKHVGELYLTPNYATWQPFGVPWPDGSLMMLLPVQPRDGKALSIAQHPVTNAQYQRFASETGRGEPVGRYVPEGSDPFNLDNWRSGFHPWREAQFNDPLQPVTCVTFHDAVAYRTWVNSTLRHGSKSASVAILPPPRLWKYAAYDSEREAETPQKWMGTISAVHHRSAFPMAVDQGRARVNATGVSDLIGNVWEWCMHVELATSPRYAASGYAPTYVTEKLERDELRGGGFLDDLERVRPYLPTSRTGGKATSHFDLGFRIAGVMPERALPKKVQLLLSLQPPASDELWQEVLRAAEP